MSLDPDLIRRIVRDCRAGATYTAVAAALNEEGLLSPDGRPWHAKFIRWVYRTATRGGLA
ncbi:Recombinase [Micromonospora sp. L5]|uniref:recombinase family protein n=1 Tax=Micromonospora sp. (strain L5) TaxID=648999 RepID=UPI0001C45C9A|nr:recombinase family protein [Micromonospora sp. L5]ADU06416.1 Recombinase [Micromonospora sp. L5]